jgi:hypothetical protein
MTDIQKLFSFSKQIAGKRVVVFGAGRSASLFLAELPIDPEFFIDNDPKREGESFLGRPVRSVQGLMEVPREELFVVICTQDFEAVGLQLSALGLVASQHFVEAPQFQIDDRPECHLLVSCIGDHGGIYRVNALTKQAEHVLKGMCAVFQWEKTRLWRCLSMRGWCGWISISRWCNGIRLCRSWTFTESRMILRRMFIMSLKLSLIALASTMD